jgi:hypothetical protein
MTREEFIKNFFITEGNETQGVWALIPKACSIAAIEYGLIGAIYDLQQQIAQKDEFIDYLDNRLINLEQEVYK